MRRAGDSPDSGNEVADQTVVAPPTHERATHLKAATELVDGLLWSAGAPEIVGDLPVRETGRVRQ